VDDSLERGDVSIDGTILRLREATSATAHGVLVRTRKPGLSKSSSRN
jgi:hypothetical protein